MKIHTTLFFVLIAIFALTISGCSIKQPIDSVSDTSDTIAPPSNVTSEDTLVINELNVDSEFEELKFDLDESFPDLSDW